MLLAFLTGCIMIVWSHLATLWVTTRALFIQSVLVIFANLHHYKAGLDKFIHSAQFKHIQIERFKSKLAELGVTFKDGGVRPTFRTGFSGKPATKI